VNDSDLLKLSFAVAVIGLLGLFWYGTASSTGYSVSQLDQLIGQKVTLNGTATSVLASKAGNTFFQLSDGTGQAKMVIFKSSDLDVSKLRNGALVKIEGKVAEYEGDVEVVVDSISFPSSQNG